MVLQVPNTDEPEPTPRVPCPYCAELIQLDARICPVCNCTLPFGASKTCLDCGAVNALAVERCYQCAGSLPVPPHPPRHQVQATPSSESLTLIDWILVLVLPCVGLMVGLAYLSSEKRARGGKMMAISLCMLFLWGVLRTFLRLRQHSILF